MWKKAHILYLIIIYGQIIWFWGGPGKISQVRIFDGKFIRHIVQDAGYNIVYSVQARFFFLWSIGQICFPTLGGQIIYFIYKNCQNGFEMYILIIIYRVCICDTLVPTRILNSEICWFCFDFPKWGPVSFIITDFNVFVQFFE